MPAPHTPRRHAALVLLASLPLGAVLYAACVEDDGPALDTLTLRDALGMAPNWLDERPQDERLDLQSRLQQAAVEQADASAWVELLPQDAALEGNDDPRVALGRLDQRRAAYYEPLEDAGVHAQALDPLLITWLDLTAERPLATACPLSPEDLEPTAPREALAASGWALEPAFDQPLNDADPRAERDALQERLPLLEAWVKRCLDAAGADLAPEGLDTRFTVWRVESAPALLAVDPSRRVILLNPVLLTLFAPADDAPQTVRQALIPTSSLDACVQYLNLYCEECAAATDYTSVDGCSDALLNASSPQQGCEALAAMERGAEGFCVNHLLYNDRQLDICVDERTPDRACVLATPTRSIVSLNGRYLDFLGDDTCVEAFTSCVTRPADPGTPGQPVDNPPANPPVVEDEPNPCCDNAADFGCFALEVCAESGALADACSEADCGDSDCSGCAEGGDACSGCEGDTF